MENTMPMTLYMTVFSLGVIGCCTCKVSFVKTHHRHDSIESTDYIANYFVLNLSVSVTTIENLRYYSANLQKICNIVGSKT